MTSPSSRKSESSSGCGLVLDADGADALHAQETCVRLALQHVETAIDGRPVDLRVAVQQQQHPTPAVADPQIAACRIAPVLGQTDQLDLRKARCDRCHRITVDRLAREGAVEIDQVQSSTARINPALSCCYGVIREDRGIIHLPLA